MLTHMLNTTMGADPQRTALVYGDMRMSYQALADSVNGLCAGLRTLGVQRADCVAVFLPNCPEFIISFYAIAQAHAIMLPLNPLFKEGEISYYLRDGQPSIVITDRRRAELVRRVAGQLDLPVELIVVDGALPSSRAFHDLIRPTSYAEQPPYDGTVLYQYSSGSTGRPKRVSKTQHNLACEIDNFAATTAMTADDAILCIIPLFHTYGVGNCLLPFACSGSKLVILEQVLQEGLPVDVPFDSRCGRVLELIAAERISILPAVPYQYSALADMPDARAADLSTLRLCFSAGNFLAREVFDRFMQRFGIPVRQQYGCTEAGSIAVNLEPASAVTYNAAGTLVRNVELRIVDDQLSPVAAEQVGSLLVKSPALTSGYDRLPDLNREAFQGGYFVTGDLGKRDRQGRLFITGRKKMFIDTGGHKVDPLEIEDLLVAHAKVAEAVVVGVAGPYGGEVIKAVVVPSAPCSEAEIVAYCSDQLAAFKVPRYVEFRDSIPKSPLGKILRKDLIQPPEPASQAQIAFREALLAAAPGEPRRALLATHLLEQIGQIVKLPPAQIDPRRPLGDFGLTSITAVELRNRLADSLGLPLSATLVWSRPTIAALAQYLADLFDAPADADGPASEATELDELALGLTEIEQLSDEEAQQMLADQLQAEHDTDER
jgi:long-chain acyl-CoA synthetase